MQFIKYDELIQKIKENILFDILENSGITSGSTILAEIEQGCLDEVRCYVNQYYNCDILFAASGVTGTTSGSTYPAEQPRDKFLVKLILDIFLYEIHTRLCVDVVPSNIQIRYDKAIDTLEKIAKRIIVPNWLPSKRIDPDTSEILCASEEKTNFTF